MDNGVIVDDRDPAPRSAKRLGKINQARREGEAVQHNAQCFLGGGGLPVSKGERFKSAKGEYATDVVFCKSSIISM